MEVVRRSLNSHVVGVARVSYNNEYARSYRNRQNKRSYLCLYIMQSKMESIPRGTADVVRRCFDSCVGIVQ